MVVLYRLSYKGNCTRTLLRVVPNMQKELYQR